MSDQAMSMVKRVARAMAKRNWPGASERDIDEMWEGWKEEAIAALTAMREPSQAMIVAGLSTGSRFGPNAMSNIYTTMIDAALRGEG